MTKTFPTLGCCGIDCGLCPRHYTDGVSRCPGCGGKGFQVVHPSCPFLTCCLNKRSLETCALCAEYPCARFDREDGTRDSFVTHRRVRPNARLIRELGLPAFLCQQGERMAFLQGALARHDDGRSKGFFCLAAALLSPEGLRAALERADRGEPLRVVLEELAEAQGEELRLRR